MKLLTIILVVLTTSCSTVNDRLYRTQKRTVQQSPYKNAEGQTGSIKAQKEFRRTKIPTELLDALSSETEKPMILIEDYEEICHSCPSFQIRLQKGDTIYKVRRDFFVPAQEDSIFRPTYEFEKIPFDPDSENGHYQMEYGDIIEIYHKVNQSDDWNSNPLQYGINDCFDGDHTIVSVIYPDQKIESMYVRCWKQKIFREKVKKN